MSLVGTRPILQDELRQYELHHRARIAIKPGITGMWQVSGRSDITDFEEVVRLDTEYISMARQNQESVTTFGEVLHSSNISYSQNRSSANDNRLMIYFQGMKVYIPDNFQPDTLLKLLQTLKKL